ncbi:E3 ubiquitin-protein ligase rnf152 [Brachyhypopomus gauderio]|uniref:E3 ubiquitin-protein ligase rnf152 n=1 Tax=Brachyhypopomus gauderio TaxID=698409 RepID=UPI004040ECE3
MTCEISEGQRHEQRMETFSLGSRQECQICFNPYSLGRRPKLLQCLHACCSACLGQLWRDHGEIRCPWCRCVTRLPAGLSVAQLPDDPDALAVISVTPLLPEHAPVFIRMPDSRCYLLPLPGDVEQTALPGEASCRLDFKGRALGEEEEEEEDEEEGLLKSSAWTGFCTVFLVAVILICLLGIVLHNMSCVSKRFSIISCG